jgi:hypothetical protein
MLSLRMGHNKVELFSVNTIILTIMALSIRMKNAKHNTVMMIVVNNPTILSVITQSVIMLSVVGLPEKVNKTK